MKLDIPLICILVIIISVSVDISITIKDLINNTTSIAELRDHTNKLGYLDVELIKQLKEINVTIDNHGKGIRLITQQLQNQDYELDVLAKELKDTK